MGHGPRRPTVARRLRARYARLSYRTCDCGRGSPRAPDSARRFFGHSGAGLVGHSMATVLIGTGFELPPFDLPEFPILRADRVPLTLQAKLLEVASKVQKHLGRPALPALFAVEFSGLRHTAELDPCVDLRRESVLGPIEPLPAYMPRPMGMPRSNGRSAFAQIGTEQPDFREIANGSPRRRRPMRSRRCSARIALRTTLPSALNTLQGVRPPMRWRHSPMPARHWWCKSKSIDTYCTCRTYGTCGRLVRTAHSWQMTGDTGIHPASDWRLQILSVRAIVPAARRGGCGRRAEPASVRPLESGQCLRCVAVVPSQCCDNLDTPAGRSDIEF